MRLLVTDKRYPEWVGEYVEIDEDFYFVKRPYPHRITDDPKFKNKLKIESVYVGIDRLDLINILDKWEHLMERDQ